MSIFLFGIAIGDMYLQFRDTILHQLCNLLRDLFAVMNMQHGLCVSSRMNIITQANVITGNALDFNGARVECTEVNLQKRRNHRKEKTCGWMSIVCGMERLNNGE